MNPRKLLAQVCLVGVILSTLNLQLSTAHAQGTAFTYQGRLDVTGVPANGTNDLTFTLYDAVSAGAAVGTSNTVNDLVISNGLFTVTLDFGAGAFSGAARWLQIAARPGVSTGAYADLAPRQAITAAPYAIFAGGASAAGVTGTLPAGALTGVNGSGLISLNAANLSSGTVPDARLSANVALRNGGNTFNGTQVVANGNITLSRNASGAIGPVFRLENNAGTGNDKARLEFYDVNIPRAALEWNIVNNDGGATWNFLNTFNATPAGTNISRLFIDHFGNVGIGTTTPAHKLDVNFGSGSGVAGFGDINGSGPLVYLSTTANGANSTVNLVSRNSHDFTFIAFPGEVGTELMRIKPNGNVSLLGELTCVAMNLTSDRNAKEDFKPVSGREVLAKVAALPITEWQYKTQGDARHIGPMAQDFHAAFGTGRDDKHIASVDADGVALAAIQGLNEKLEDQLKERNAQLDRMRTENQSLAERLAAIERALGLAQESAPRVK